jgi:hypothetical protein
VKTGKAGFESATFTVFISILREFMGTYRVLYRGCDYKTGVLKDFGSLKIPHFKPEFYLRDIKFCPSTEK